VPKVEILRRVILGNLLFPKFRERKPLVDPAEKTAWIVRAGGIGCYGHASIPHSLHTYRQTLLGGLRGIDADRDVRIPGEHVGRDREVLWRRLALEHASRYVESRTVAGAIKAAGPIRAQIDPRQLKWIVRIERP